MYTRPYNEEGHGIVIPESYGGTLLRESERLVERRDTDSSDTQEKAAKNPWESEEIETAKEIHNDADSVETFAFLSKLPFGNFLTNISKNGKFGLQKIGLEEILIIATAAFLFFTKDGDRECAIMLLLLLFLG